MTLSLGLGMAIVFVLLFIVVLATISEGLVKIAAKSTGEDPTRYSVLPKDIVDLFRRKTSKPAHVPDEDHYVSFSRGFDINLLGEPNAEVPVEAVHASTYAIKPKDFVGMSPIPKVVIVEGEAVKAGDPIFYDKQRPEIMYAAPVSGELLRIVRGEKRSINEVVLLADKDMEYRQYELPDLATASRGQLIEFLLGSGAWPFIRQRPFDIVAEHDKMPKAIFVTTFDTAPLAPGFDRTVAGKGAEFRKGLEVLQKLAGDNKVHLGLDGREGHAPVAELLEIPEGVEHHWFDGPHPAGNVGVHIHHINPVNSGETVWHLDVYGVLVLGTLFTKGIFDTERVIALTGYEMPNPRYVRVHQGLCVEKLVSDIQFKEQVNTTDKEGNLVKIDRKAIRLVSGDALTGKEITAEGYLGFFHDQLMTIEEGDYYELLGWLIPQKGHPTSNKTFPGGYVPSSLYKADTQQNGERRAFVVSGEYESVLPMDIYPQHLLRAIMANDYEKMEGLGILELGEEDVALCEYVCTSKHPVQKTLRKGLEMIREQG